VELPGHLDLPIGVRKLRSATQSTAGSGSREAGHGAFSYKVAFKLGKGAKDVKDELATAGGGVDLFGEALEADAALIQPSHQLDELGEGSAEAIEAPDHEGVTGADILEGLGESGPVCFGTTRRIAEDLLALCCLQSIELQGEILIVGRDAGIPNSIRHITEASSHKPEGLASGKTMILRRVSVTAILARDRSVIFTAMWHEIFSAIWR
jgi:hypothetical protein